MKKPVERSRYSLVKRTSAWRPSLSGAEGLGVAPAKAVSWCVKELWRRAENDERAKAEENVTQANGDLSAKTAAGAYRRRQSVM